MQQLRLQWIACAMVFAGAVAGMLFAARRPAGVDIPSRLIQAALDEGDGSRTLEPMLSADIPYRPFLARADQPATRLDSRAVSIAARLQQVSEGFPQTSADHAAAAGLSLLFVNDTDAALDQLRDAVHLAPKAADYWSALAAASIVRGRQTDLLQALDAAEMALEIAPGLPSAAFNRAMVLERLGLESAARDAWTAVAASQADSGWGNEARSRLGAMPPAPRAAMTAGELLALDDKGLLALSGAGVDRIRQSLEDDLMPRMGAACRAAPSEDCTILVKGVTRIASVISTTSPDSWWAALADQLTTLGEAGLRRDGHAIALISYGDGVRLFARDQVAESAKVFAVLARPEPDGLVSVQLNARYYVCLDAYFRAQHEEARRCLDRLDAEVSARKFLFMRGRVNWIRAQISLAEGNLARAAGDFEHAVTWLREAGDTNQLAAIMSLRASLRDQLGLFDAAWADRIHALTTARLDSRRRHTLFTSAARSCLLQRLPRAALYFQRAAVQNAAEWGQPGALVEAHLSEAAVLQRLGRLAAADERVVLARRHFESITDQRARSRMQGELIVTEGEVLAEKRPEAALTLLHDATRTLSAMQFDLLRARVELAMGLAAERTRQYPLAREAFERGVAIIEQQRVPLSGALQMQSLDVAWEMYDRLIARRLEDEGDAAALSAAESARTQVLRRFLPKGAGVALMPALATQLPARSTLLYFVVLDDVTVRWTVSAAGAASTRLPVGRVQVDYLVRRVRRTLDRPTWKAEMAEVSAPLLDLLFSGARPAATGDTLIIVPDGALHELPFGILTDTRTGRYLVDDHPIAVAPSLRLFMEASRAAEQRFGALDRALVVEGRTGPAEGQATLAALPHSQKEIETVAALYEGSQVLSGAAATPRRFLAEAGEFPVVHFSGHAMADRLSPELSRLFLAISSGEPSGWLLFRDLESVSFERTGLVVLAACSTGAGRIYRGEGAVSLARPFLGKGAAGVVYTLWDVGDNPSMRLLTGLHAGIRRGLDPVVALQQIQAQLIHSGGTADDVRTWAAFQYAGGVRGAHKRQEETRR